jgi:hypothetical protein
MHRMSDDHVAVDDRTHRSFSDVPPSHPFAADIDWMADVGLGEGFPDGSYRPGDVLTRQAFAAFLHRYDGDLGAGVQATVADGTLTVDLRGCTFGDLRDEPGYVTVIAFPALLGSWESPDDIVAATIAGPAGADGTFLGTYPDIPSGFDIRIESTCTASADLEPPSFSYPTIDVENPGPGPGPVVIEAMYDGDEITVDASGCVFVPNGGYLSVYAVPEGGAFPPPGPAGMLGSVESVPVDWPGNAHVSFEADVAESADLHAFCSRSPGTTGESFSYPVLNVDNADPWAGREVTGTVADGEVTVTITGCRFGSSGGYPVIAVFDHGLPYPGGPYIGFYYHFEPIPPSGELTVSYPVDAGPDVEVRARCMSGAEGGPGSFDYPTLVIDNPL